MRLALFDFDGTVTSSDSFIGFLIFCAGYKKFILNMTRCLPYLIGMKLGIVPNSRAKEAVLTRFFAGEDAEALYKRGDYYGTHHLDVLVRDSARRRIHEHLKNGDRVIVVSASLDIWLKKWCENNSVELIATQPMIKDGRITGRLAVRNCYGQEKVNRIKQILNPSDYAEIYAYGDSRGDREMLAIAHKPFYRYF